MTDPTASVRPDEQAEAEFLLAYDRAAEGDRPAVLSDFCERQPTLAATFRRLAAAERRLHLAAAPDAEPPRLDPGRRLGPYRVERFLARGGMGEVYVAAEDRLRRQVALKVLRGARLTPHARERFEREMLVLARLHQTRIVAIYGTGEKDGLQYLAMPLIDGVSLHRVIRSASVRESTPLRGSTPGVRDLVRSATDGAAPTGGDPGPPPAGRRRLSPDYVRSVARIVAQAAEAVHYAHERGVCHRDIKPSNLMVDRNEQCWIIDFGLAGYLDASGPADGSRPGAADGAGSVDTHGAIGTPAYMAPEQYDGRADRRSDVWALGATLYELLALRPAFSAANRTDLGAAVRTRPHRPLAEVVEAIPPALEAVCRKALRKAPAERYQSAGDLARDLHRWLNREPTVAEGRNPVLWVRLWIRRNRSWAAAVVTTLLALCASSLLFWQVAAAARQELRQRDRAALLQDLQGRVLRPHVNGWSDDCWDLARTLAKEKADPDLRDQAVGALAGVDARLRRSLITNGSTGIAASLDGKRLLLAGFSPGRGSSQDALIATGDIDAPVPTGVPGDGPVAFTTDGVPLQVVPPAQGRRTIQVWNVDTRKIVGEFPLADADPAGGAALEYERAFFSDGGRFVVSVQAVRDPSFRVLRSTLTVWDVTQGRRVRQVECRADAAAVTPDGALLAAGDDGGAITLWPLPQGEPLVTLQGEADGVSALAFGPSPRRGRDQPRTALSNWLLASGDQAGRAVVWDLDRRGPLAFCPVMGNAIGAAAFSPDGMTVAFDGRGTTQLCDVATGHRLLTINNRRNYVTSVAFSSDGAKLAVSSFPAHGAQGGLDLWDVEPGRGVTALRGLTGRIEVVRATPAGETVAALGNNWQAGVWDVRAGRLRWARRIPRGVFVDNADLALRADGKQVAAASAEQAQAWDVDTGATAETWALPPGMTNAIAFHPSGKLLLLRTETKDGNRLPVFGADPKDHPRVVRLRELLPRQGLRLIREIEDHSWHVYRAFASPDGTYFVVSGRDGSAARARSFVAYDGPTGHRLWSVDQKSTEQNQAVSFSPSGNLMAFTRHGKVENENWIVKMPSGEVVEPWVEYAGRVLGHRQWARAAAVEPHDFAVYQRGATHAWVSLGRDHPHSGTAQFTADETRLIWGSIGGQVMVADLPEIRRRLTAAGLSAGD